MGARRRYLEPAIAPVLPRKMVFIGGPRQVGKTTLALSLVGKDADETHPAYFNWDDPRSAASRSPCSARTSASTASGDAIASHGSSGKIRATWSTSARSR